MRIAYVNKVCMLSNMPSAVFSAMNAYGFALNGVDTHLLTRQGNGLGKDILRTLNLNPDPFFHLHRFSASWMGLVSNEVFYARVSRWLIRKHESMPFDILLTRDPGFLPFLCFLKKRLNVPVFYQSHNFYWNVSKRPELNRINQWKYRMIERICLTRMNGLLTLQQPMLDLYRDCVSIPMAVGRPGLIRRNPIREDAFDAKTVVYVGSFQRIKGIEQAVKAFARVCKPGWRLRLLGGRNIEEMDYAKKLADEYGIQSQTEISGWLSQPELAEKLSCASLGLLLLEDNFYNRYLTAPSKLFDYLANGIPVIATDTPAVRDFISHNREGLLVQAGVVRRMAAAMRFLFRDRRFYHEMTNRVWDRAGDFLWKERARDMLTFMEQNRSKS